MRTPSFDRTNETWDDVSAVRANEIASAHGARKSDATTNVGTGSFMRLRSRAASAWVGRPPSARNIRRAVYRALVAWKLGSHRRPCWRTDRVSPDGRHVKGTDLDTDELAGAGGTATINRVSIGAGLGPYQEEWQDTTHGRRSGEALDERAIRPIWSSSRFDRAR
jgi:hypothetical protein